METGIVCTKEGLSVSVDAAAELVLMEMYEKFFKSFPSINAKTLDVQRWILQWFAIDDTFLNDIAVPKFVAQITISGTRLWSLSDEAILQYLVIQNVRLCAGSGGQVYSNEIITKLAADIAEAKKTAIPGWNGSSAPPKKEEFRGQDMTVAKPLGSAEILRNLHEAVEKQLPAIDFSNFFTAVSITSNTTVHPSGDFKRQFLVSGDGDLLEVEDDVAYGYGVSGNTVDFVGNNLTTSVPTTNGSQNTSQAAQPVQMFAPPQEVDDESSEIDTSNDSSEQTSFSIEEDNGYSNGDGDGGGA